ncbi:MAG: exonuclease subunit SbcD [Gemmataceae bacterium]|nr:exonuclease subunit SbcD [Gemmata sp.]MDW8196247.1 exonuclease subunit SbcD [Gemmataceae bacterium]
MRILHTADWHLGDRLGRIDRTDDLRTAVERIAAYCQEHAVDVLVVAGDLFSELSRPDGLRDSIRHWREVFHNFLAGGGTILTLTGNHDNENFCQTLVSAMTLASPTIGQPGEVVPPGRLYLATQPMFLRLEDRRRGFPVQFVLMPYPTPHRFLKGDSKFRYASPEEKNRVLVQAWAEELRAIRQHPRYDAQAPAVLAAHIHLHGCNIGPGLFRMAPEDDVVIEGSELAEQYDYVALGHIHKPQWVQAAHVRYSGSIETMDLGEQNDHKGVVLVEVGRQGRNKEPEVLPLPSTAIYEVVVLEPSEDLPRLKREYPHAKNDLVKLQIRYTAGKDQLEEVLRELERIFPRWYARDWKETGALMAGSLVSESSPTNRGFRETVRDYLQQELVQHEAEERDAILQIVEQLMEDEDTSRS